MGYVEVSLSPEISAGNGGEREIERERGRKGGREQDQEHMEGKEGKEKGVMERRESEKMKE